MASINEWQGLMSLTLPTADRNRFQETTALHVARSRGHLSMAAMRVGMAAASLPICTACSCSRSSTKPCACCASCTRTQQTIDDYELPTNRLRQDQSWRLVCNTSSLLQLLMSSGDRSQDVPAG